MSEKETEILVNYTSYDWHSIVFNKDHLYFLIKMILKE